VNSIGTTLAGLALSGAIGMAALVVPARPAHACGGFAEYGGSCNDAGADAANEARWMLHHVVTAIQGDEPKALSEFSRGAAGFRTQDIYVFCVGPDGAMSAHPNPELAGHDATHLRDSTGKAFIQAMRATAREGQISEIHYLFPKLGSHVETPKTTYYTRVKDQVCGVGYYADAREPAEATRAARPEGDLTRLRHKLDAAIPADLRPDWTAFLAALDRQQEAQAATLAKARQSLQAADATLAGKTSARPDQ
jgi:hypothetical protein